MLQFGRCQLHPQRGELFVDGVAVRLGRRAFDVLMVLIEARGELVSKDEILSRVWSGRIVEENTLQVHMSALRKALGDDGDALKTLPGRGYRFVAEITTETDQPKVAGQLGARSSGSIPSPLPPTNLSEPASELIGRDAEVGEITDLVKARRLVSLVGTGGVGKTRLSLEVARRFLPKFADGVWVAELGPLSDAELVPVTVASALGLTMASGVLSPERVAAALGTKHVLLILDNCEHVIEAAAHMAEALLRANPVVCVLATGREPLRLLGEVVYRVPSLRVPAEGIEGTEDLLEAGAVKLFIARVRAVEPHFAPDSAVAGVVGTICRRLDGIPLAIELAAARVASLGLEALELRLDDRFKLLTGGYRTAMPRQQTLRATLDWSYELLPESERVVLHRVSIFAGAFALKAATAVVTDATISASDVVDAITNLVAKSLLTAMSGGATTQYRLLETTRLYGHEKLVAAGELDQFARRHAEYYRHELETATAEWGAQPMPEWLAKYRRHVDNVRAALNWAFSPHGDETIGQALVVGSVPLWFQLSLLEECLGHVQRALGGLGPGSGLGTRVEMQLRAALGLSLFYTKGALGETDTAWAGALEIAQSLNDTDYQLQALWGLWVQRLTTGEFRIALPLAERFCTLAAKDSDPADLLIGDRMVAHVLHYMGNQSVARLQMERALHRNVGPAPRSQTIRYLLDLRSSARTILAQILWLQGFPDQALRNAQISVEEALATDHAISVCYALALAQCPFALSIGDLEVLEKSVTMALDHSARYSLPYWHAWVRCFQGVLAIRRGDPINGLYVLRIALDELRETGFGRGLTLVLGHLAEVLLYAGQTVLALAAVDDALARSERDGERCWVCELLRIKGEIGLREQGEDGAKAAEQHFLQGLQEARQQGALSLELRCATSLARLWHAQGRTSQARELLQAVYDRFTEGFQTADLNTANALLETLG